MLASTMLHLLHAHTAEGVYAFGKLLGASNGVMSDSKFISNDFILPYPTISCHVPILGTCRFRVLISSISSLCVLPRLVPLPDHVRGT